MTSSAAIILAFANDWVDEKRHLRSLLDESKAIANVLAPLVEAGRLAMPPPIHNATMGEVLGAFRARRYRDRVRIFHFGGHASGSALLFEDADGKPTAAHASALATYLGQQRGLALVFLNGCSTEAQVRGLREAGVKAVVATTRAIQDDVAAEFATAFYAELSTRSLREAFDAAASAVRLSRGDDPTAVTRDVSATSIAGPPGTPAWPWMIDCDRGYEAWTLGSEPIGPGWRARLGFAATAIGLLLVTTLALSAGARHTACRAPGLHSLCARGGLGNVPSPMEQALWDTAVEQPSCDGLRAYLRTYGTGAFAEEATSRLAGLSIQRVETLGPDREVRFPLAVRLTDPPLATEGEARRDALTRGNLDAETACKSVGMKAQIVSARAEPRSRGWRCPPESGRGYTCGFDGEVVCHVRDQIVTDHERCNSQDK